ncbi:MAG: allB [Segetibacter sp.]|nr:allB [Segetibacter sp.]
MPSFAIKSDNTVLPSGIKPAYVIVTDGKIEDVVSQLPLGKNIELVDVGDKVLMPGVIDPHVHINEPGRTEWEGFDTATKAAIAGGVTTVIDMPLNSSPVTTSIKAFEEKIAATKGKLHTNVGFWGGVVPGNSNEIEGLTNKGVIGFKAFLTYSGIDDFPNVTEEDLRQAMPIIAKYNLPLLVHCELSASIQETSNNPNETSYRHYLASRPKEWEDRAVEMMIRLGEEFNCRTHIVHLSSANSIEQIRIAKNKGLPLTVETGQHYLYFNAEEIPDGKTAYKCAPPIREQSNNEKLWEALIEGIIDLVATDHSPSSPSLKEIESGNLMKAWGGIASLQFALPALWTKASERNIPLDKIVQWLCVAPAQLIGKAASKGRIEKGYDADLLVFDPAATFIVREEMILHRHKLTPYLNETLKGAVEQTYISGVKVFDKGSFNLNKGNLIFK